MEKKLRPIKRPAREAVGAVQEASLKRAGIGYEGFASSLPCRLLAKRPSHAGEMEIASDNKVAVTWARVWIGLRLACGGRWSEGAAGRMRRRPAGGAQAPLGCLGLRRRFFCNDGKR